MTRCSGTALAILCAAAPLTAAMSVVAPKPAMAAPGPSVIPSRDVDITYRVERSGEATFRQRVRWLADQRIERIDGPGDSYMLIDEKRDDVTLVTPSTKSFTTLAQPPQVPLQPDFDAAVQKGPVEKISRHVCTEWHWTDSDGAHSVCVTDDGVLMRSSVGDGNKVKAISVTFRRLNPNTFRVPAGYQPALGAGSDDDLP